MMVQAQLDALRALVEADPRYAPLLEVLRVPCASCLMERTHCSWHSDGQGSFTRIVADWPRGAVAGMVKAVVSEQATQEDWRKGRGWWTRLLIDLDTRVCYDENPDEQTIVIVSRAVKEEGICADPGPPLFPLHSSGVPSEST